MNAPTDNALIIQRGKELGPPTEVMLGSVVRTCLNCGREWVDPRCSCGSFEFTERAVRVRPMVIESLVAPNKAAGSAVAERRVKVEVQSEEDVALLRLFRLQLEKTVQQLGAVDAVMHRIVGRFPVDMAALFQEATTPREIAERDERMADVNRDIWYALQSTVHFAAETSGDIPSGGAAPFNASLALQCRQVIYEIDRALQKYEEAVKQ